MAVKAVKNIMSSPSDQNVNLKMIKIVKKLGETVEESEMIQGALIEQKSISQSGLSRIEKAKIGLIQFQISPPKTNVILIPFLHCLFIFYRWRIKLLFLITHKWIVL